MRRTATFPYTSPATGLAALALAAAVLSLAACAGTTAVSRSGAPRTGARPAAGEEVATAWELAAGDLSSQVLFRVAYDGPEGNGSFRLTLLLADAGRYQARAVDPLGRALWTLDVAGDEGLWIDHRNRLACRLEGRFDVAAARLVPFPLAALPALLLGRLPAPPATPLERRGDRLSWRDDEGRRWTARLEDGAVAAWTLWLDDGPAVWWQRAGAGEAVLSDRRRGTQLRWREVLREALPEPPEAVSVPADYAPVDCSRVYVAGDG